MVPMPGNFPPPTKVEHRFHTPRESPQPVRRLPDLALRKALWCRSRERHEGPSRDWQGARDTGELTAFSIRLRALARRWERERKGCVDFEGGLIGSLVPRHPKQWLDRVRQPLAPGREARFFVAHQSWRATLPETDTALRDVTQYHLPRQSPCNDRLDSGKP